MADLAQHADSDAIEILQHWKSEGVDPLKDLLESFERERPNVSVTQRTVPVSKLRLTAKSEVLQGDPPTLWVEWPGKNLSPTVNAGVVGDITELWESEGLVDTYVSGAKDAARFDGSYRCIPTDMYRINNLFYNVEHAERAGVDVERLGDPPALLDALESLAEVTDEPPFICSAKNPLGVLQVWETLVLAYGGKDTYEDLLDGNVTSHREEVRRAVETLRQLMTYTADDVAFVSSSRADARFAQGDGTFAHNGGWAVGRIQGEAGFEYGTDWGYTPFPGTEDYYQMNMNALIPSGQTSDDESVEALLSHLASRRGIAHIANLMGAVPPREDVDVTSFHPMIQRHTEALESATYHANSMTHGLGVPPETLIELKSAIVPFITNRDVEETTDALVSALV
jgi:glucose/mannose transport system substrate-binding protein